MCRYNPSVTNDPQPRGFAAWWRHAFAIDTYDESGLEPEDKYALQSLATGINRRGLSSAAILWVYSNRHLSWFGSQILVAATPVYDLAHMFLRPLLTAIGMYVPPSQLPRLSAAFEKRYAVEYFVQQLEALQAGETLAPTEYNEPAAEADQARDETAPPGS